MKLTEIRKVSITRESDVELSDALRAVATKPTDVESRKNLASLFERRHNYSEAILQYGTLIELDPPNREEYQRRRRQNLDFGTRDMGFLD